MSKFSLKKHLQSLTKEQIVEVVLDAYNNSKAVQEYFDFYLQPNEKEKIKKYKAIIEKEFDIDAETGAILKSETETKNRIVETPKISYEQAKEIALKQSKDGKFKEIDLKHKNGKLVYDIELAEGFMDREFLIDANTGKILKDKKDF